MSEIREELEKDMDENDPSFSHDEYIFDKEKYPATYIVRMRRKDKVDLNIRLSHYNIRIHEFFQAIFEGMVNLDSRIESYIIDWKNKEESIRKREEKIFKQILRRRDKKEKWFDLDDEDIEEIIDEIRNDPYPF